jgi:hypothetical protein
MPVEKSHGMTVAPRPDSGSLEDPVPAARSRITSPRIGDTALTSALRQTRVWPRASTSFATS